MLPPLLHCTVFLQAFEWPWGWVKTEGLRVARLEDSTLFKKSLPVDLQLIIND
jgi:hypothetical protein